ncbi:unnamed protein product [Lymnaea stagnalis]|uniref:non-specific serine/threonine protein kinase n=1 Tax=Lymnaea stagnalis TaxID=6523 RepID=A0AAV2H950_LYMST
MIRRSRVCWFTKIVKVLASAAAFLSWTGDVIVKKGADGAVSNLKVSSPYQEKYQIQQNPTQLPTVKQVKLVDGESCPFETSKNVESSCDIFYVLVSTIDGRFSALDLHKQGKLAWSVEADTRPLYSSSLANMEMIRNGKKFRLIPSLDGALYQFDGEKVEAIPMSAESLLSSTYRLSDDSMIVGSKELQNFGLDLQSGEIQFSCSSEGCTSAYGEAKDSAINGNSILVLTRSTHVIRSVDMKYGNEKWNFSVGQHQVSLPTKHKPSQLDDDDDDEDNIDNLDEKMGNYNIPFFSASKEDCASEEMFPEDIDYENFLRLMVPEGRVVALSKDDSSQVSWEHKFESPIAKAWLLRHGKLEPMSLFDSRHVPILNTYSTDDIENESLHQPLLYIGSHQKLLYIQPSPHMESLLKSFTQHRIGHVFDPNIKVSWRPYLNTASVRTPIFGGNRPQFTGPNKSDRNTQKSSSTSLSVWHEDYPFDTGYFLYPEFRDTRSTRRGQIMLIEAVRQRSQEEDGKGLMETIPASIWYHWKEVTIISIVVSFLVHFVLIRLNKTDLALMDSAISEGSQNSGGNVNPMVSSESSPTLTVQVSNPGEYISRFASDFECLHCLGKGGFGVVFEAVNKVDAQHYAVKRTMLPRSEGAKEKVLREVRVLAKLEHIGIVRYFNAWVESPPTGWQEEKDKQLEMSNISGVNTYTDDLTVSIQKCKELLEGRVHAEEHRQKSLLSTNSDDLLLPKHSLIKNSGSGEFSVHSDFSDGLETSERDVPHSTNELFSFGFDSYSEQTELFSDSRSSIPFSNYTSNSSAVSSYSHGLGDLDMTGDSVVFEQNCNLQSEDSTVFENTSSLLSDDSVVFENSNETKHIAAVSKLEKKMLTGVAIPNTKPFLAVTSSSEGEKEKQAEDSESATALKPGSNYFLYIQMQLYRKDTLKDWLSNNTLNRDRHLILDIFDQIVCAVDYVHGCGLMHRDLKPSNIFFSADGVVKVGDFGLVTALSDQEADNPATDPNASGRHTAEVGTTLYMSPEQIARKPYDLKIDIFSLGLIFLELWIPFSTQMERIRTLQDAKKQIFPHRFTKELPLESEIVFEMTNQNAELRPTTQEILDHPLFKDIAPTRAGTSKRKRTISDNNINQTST